MAANSSRKARAARELVATSVEPYRTGAGVDKARWRRAAAALVSESIAPYIRGFQALDLHTRMRDVADEVEGLGHPGMADRVRDLADEVLKAMQEG